MFGSLGNHFIPLVPLRLGCLLKPIDLKVSPKYKGSQHSIFHVFCPQHDTVIVRRKNSNSSEVPGRFLAFVLFVVLEDLTEHLQLNRTKSKNPKPSTGRPMVFLIEIPNSPTHSRQAPVVEERSDSIGVGTHRLGFRRSEVWDLKVEGFRS